MALRILFAFCSVDILGSGVVINTSSPDSWSPSQSHWQAKVYSGSFHTESIRFLLVAADLPKHYLDISTVRRRCTVRFPQYQGPLERVYPQRIVTCNDFARMRGM